MHSSRMRTGRSLTVCCSLLPGGVLPAGGGSPCQGGLPGLGGFLPDLGGGLPGPGGVCLVRGGLPGLGGLPGPGEVCLVWGVCLVRGGGGSLETPPVNRITDTCKNITLATTSLRPVKMTNYRLDYGLSPDCLCSCQLVYPLH